MLHIGGILALITDPGHDQHRDTTSSRVAHFPFQEGGPKASSPPSLELLDPSPQREKRNSRVPAYITVTQPPSGPIFLGVG